MYDIPTKKTNYDIGNGEICSANKRVFLEHTQCQKSNLELTYVMFLLCYNDGRGGSSYSETATTIQMKLVIFQQSSATGYGGGGYWINFEDFSLQQCCFFNCSSNNWGASHFSYSESKPKQHPSTLELIGYKNNDCQDFSIYHHQSKSENTFSSLNISQNTESDVTQDKTVFITHYNKMRISHSNFLGNIGPTKSMISNPGATEPGSVRSSNFVGNENEYEVESGSKQCEIIGCFFKGQPNYHFIGCSVSGCSFDINFDLSGNTMNWKGESNTVLVPRCNINIETKHNRHEKRKERILAEIILVELS